MSNEEPKLECPKCHELISIDAVLTNQIKEKIKSGMEVEQKAKELELANKSVEIKKKEAELAKAKDAVNSTVDERVAEKLAAEKIEIIRRSREQAAKEKEAEFKILEEQIKEQDQKLSEANAEALRLRMDRHKFEKEKKNFKLEQIKQIEAERQKIETEAVAKATELSQKEIIKLQKKISEDERLKDDEKKILEEQLADKENKLKEANEKELEIRREKNKLEEERKSFELEKQRQLDEERKKIAEDASKKAAEEQQYNIAQLNKKLTDAMKANDELRRKLEQGSQQTQGEVLELEVEELLKQEFVNDEILSVPKGINGADIIQKVFTRTGRDCGQIVWEIKKTKAWSEGYVQKLKDDQRAIKADLAVIVSAVLPKDVNTFKYRDGVWICDIKMAIALATALRMSLESVAREKATAVGKNEKIEILYSYITGVEFRQRVEAIVEAFTGMQEELNKEKRVYQKIWAEREKQIQKVITNTVGMYGDLSGLITLPQIKMLELESGNEEGKQDGLFGEGVKEMI